MSLCTSTSFAVPAVSLALGDLVGCMRRDNLADCLTVAARAASFDMVLLAGTAAPAATRSLTCRFFA